MELKYTLEILTKDIQDIEKLVGNLQNSPEGSTLEMDLALSKLRNVYDILTAIRSDMDTARKVKAETSVRGLADREPEAGQEPAATEPAREEVKEEPPEAKGETAELPQEPPAKPGPAVTKNAGIVAEKFKAGSNINENLAGSREPNMDSKLMGQPIDSISRNIGINDRFLIIRELFDGDSDRFVKLIRDLDQAGDLQSANRLLEEQFEQSPDHEGISILASLVKRRYNRN
jgi:hypothetical protein